VARHRRHEDHEEHPSEAWLIALADMMTLLMVTFLMMFAISNLDLKKFQTFKEAFAKGTGTVLPQLPGEGVPTEGDPTDKPLAPKDGDPSPKESAWAANVGGPGKPSLDKTKLEELRKVLVQKVKQAGLADRVDVASDPRGIVLYVTNGVLFDSGAARLTPAGNLLLDGLGPVFRSMSNQMIVEGHTDNRPINSDAFPSNWELSTARATAVLRNLIEKEQVAKERLFAAGYADTKPRKPGSSPAALALNRRVDIVVVAAPDAPKKVVAAKATLAPTSPAPHTSASPKAHI
jgi:chemotaxis protein MotB